METTTLGTIFELYPLLTKLSCSAYMQPCSFFIGAPGPDEMNNKRLPKSNQTSSKIKIKNLFTKKIIIGFYFFHSFICVNIKRVFTYIDYKC